MADYPVRLTRIDEYTPLLGADAVDRIRAKAERLHGLEVVHVNATYHGGGVAELLSSLVVLMNSVGIRTGWRTLRGSPEFFDTTKRMHDGLQGDPCNHGTLRLDVYEEMLAANAVFQHLDQDVVIIHDPQPLALVSHFEKRGPWIWCCHPDLSNPDPALWSYLARFVEQYDAAIFSIPEYRQRLCVPQHFIMPAIDSFVPKNQRLGEEEIAACLLRYDIPTDLPLVVQVSRFDRAKDPEGVAEAARIARRSVDFRLILLGNMAGDDPTGREVYESLLPLQDDRTRVLIDPGDPILVNALQSSAAVVLQKSLHEGFGLTVTEAMWKGAAVIGGNVGGICHQIRDGENGFLVSSVPEAAQRIVTLLQDRELAERLGRAACETVRTKFLMARYLEDYLDLMTDLLRQRESGRRSATGTEA